MKIMLLRGCGLAILVVGLTLVSGCVVQPNGRVAFEPLIFQPPVVMVAPPAPVVVAPAPAVVMVPDSYVWDGYEYVGLVGGQYFYLGAGNLWLPCEPFRLDHFHGWERYHPDWSHHVIVNVRFRKDRYGHVYARRSVPAKKQSHRG